MITAELIDRYGYHDVDEKDQKCLNCVHRETDYYGRQLRHYCSLLDMDTTTNYNCAHFCNWD